MPHTILFSPIKIGHAVLKNRIFMAPLTRLRAIEPGDIPSKLAIEYYAQRASAGLIITEATQVSWQAKGYAGAPGLHTDEQQKVWEEIVNAVHENGGKIAIQLWHTGLVSHASLQPHNLAPISASAIDVEARTSLRDSHDNVIREKASPAREASFEEIQQVIADFAAATQRAKAAGFDFIEIHGAHGYLLSQFWAKSINQRTDSYGGNLENRARLMLEVLDACIQAWDKEHVGIRLSPLGMFNNVDFGYEEEESLWLIKQINQRQPAFLHISEPDWAGGIAYSQSFRQAIRESFTGSLIVAGAYDADKAEKRLEEQLTDAIAFGRAYIANPDLPERIKSNATLNTMDPKTAYAGGAEGYTDYPTMK